MINLIYKLMDADSFTHDFTTICLFFLTNIFNS